MARRCIGLDIAAGISRMVVGRIESGRWAEVTSFVSQAETLGEQLGELKSQLAGDVGLGDRIAVALPAESAFLRVLEFPFRDPKKIRAALPLALNARLPLAVEDCATAMQMLGGDEGQQRVLAAAVPRKKLDDILTAAESVGLPIHLVDLWPHALTAVVTEQADGQGLVLASGADLCVSLMAAGRIQDYRLLPGAAVRPPAAQASWIQQQLAVMQARDGESAAEVLVLGNSPVDDLPESLRALGITARPLELSLAGPKIPAPLTPAAVLMLRAEQLKNPRLFNFRQGDFALKGEWQKLKRSLTAAAVVLVLSGALLMTSGVLKYRSTAAQLEGLEQRLTAVYRATVNSTGPIVDVPLQMQSALDQLRERGLVLTQDRLGGLAALEVLSRHINADLAVREVNYNPQEIRIEGRADSFDRVNQFNEALMEEAMIKQGQIADAKMTLEGDQVDFRLHLTLQDRGTTQ